VQLPKRVRSCLPRRERRGRRALARDDDGRVSRCPLLLDCPASVPRGESSDKGQRVLPLIGVMLPVIGGLSVTPFSSSRRWPGDPICTPLGRLKWQFRLALAARSHAIRWPRLLAYATDSLVAFGQSGLPYYSSRQGRCSVVGEAAESSD
jgi:hypothetical protein